MTRSWKDHVHKLLERVIGNLIAITLMIRMLQSVIDSKHFKAINCLLIDRQTNDQYLYLKARNLKWAAGSSELTRICLDKHSEEMRVEKIQVTQMIRARYLISNIKEGIQEQEVEDTNLTRLSLRPTSSNAEK